MLLLIFLAPRRSVSYISSEVIYISESNHKHSLRSAVGHLDKELPFINIHPTLFCSHSYINSFYSIPRLGFCYRLKCQHKLQMYIHTLLTHFNTYDQTHMKKKVIFVMENQTIFLTVNLMAESHTQITLLQK